MSLYLFCCNDFENRFRKPLNIFKLRHASNPLGDYSVMEGFLKIAHFLCINQDAICIKTFDKFVL